MQMPSLSSAQSLADDEQAFRIGLLVSQQEAQFG
jgi:hypothetical protein